MSRFSRLGNDLYSGKRSFNIVGNAKRWFIISGILVIASILVLATKGINQGIEFRGGSEFRIAAVADTSFDPANEAVGQIDTTQVPRITVIGTNSLRIQTEALSAEQTTELTQLLAEAYDVEPGEITTNFVGPVWGQDVTTQALQGLVIFLVLVSLVMILYFRRWRMALAAIIALFHDLIITVGIYALTGFEVTPASVIGFLTILGYSLYDTVVVFDKVRENTEDVYGQTRYTYGEAANLAVNQTFVRSINTSVVGLLPVGSILFVGAFFLGAGTLRDIALALFIGLALSTLSSIFIATPVDVALENRSAKVIAHNEKVHAARGARSEASDTDSEDLGEDEDREYRNYAGGVIAGQHLGQSAQPKRRRKR